MTDYVVERVASWIRAEPAPVHSLEMHISAIDAKAVERFLLSYSKYIAGAMERAARMRPVGRFR